jgi:hypothetical protein
MLCQEFSRKRLIICIRIDEDDITFMPNIHNVILQHSQDLLAGNGVQFAEPICTAIISQVKKSVC